MLRCLWWLARLATLASLSTLAGCGSNAFRKGGEGETCTRTDDCESPLVCISATCLPPGSTTTTGTGAQGGDTTTSTGGTGGTGGTTGIHTGGTGGTSTGGTSTGGTGGATNTLDPELCSACLDDLCSAEKAACGADCLALEGCIEALCGHLSEIGSSEEGTCQVYCQQLHLSSKDEHLDLVNCAFGSSCAPCSSYPYDYVKCRDKATEGVCAAADAACTATQECPQYRACVAICATLDDCLACDDTPEGQSGAALMLDYETCIAGECIEESWLQ